MNPAVSRMLERYNCRSVSEHERALREILQEIALVGLWRSKFFEHAAFYGGTALRIFYGLDRFSEDLDFTLHAANDAFSWEVYEAAIVDEMASFGFKVEVKEKLKKMDTPIKSAFLKANTLRELLQIGITASQLKGVNPDALVRIKIEIDTAPPLEYQTEQKYLRDPIPVPVSCVSESQLFAAKLNAAFYRTWKNRVKGRDWYDVVWFIRREIPLDLKLFGKFQGKENLTNDQFHSIAQERIDQLNIEDARQDISPFLKNPKELEVWSPEFFRHWLSTINLV